MKRYPLPSTHILSSIAYITSAAPALTPLPFYVLMYKFGSKNGPIFV